jgi:hypothetical protein
MICCRIWGKLHFRPAHGETNRCNKAMQGHRGQGLPSMIFFSLGGRLYCVDVKPPTEWLVYQPVCSA